MFFPFTITNLPEPTEEEIKTLMAVCSKPTPEPELSQLLFY